MDSTVGGNPVKVSINVDQNQFLQQQQAMVLPVWVWEEEHTNQLKNIFYSC